MSANAPKNKYSQNTDPHEKRRIQNLPECVRFLHNYCIAIHSDWQNAAWIGSLISRRHSKRSSSALNGQIQSRVPPCEAPIYQMSVSPFWRGARLQKKQHKGLQHLQSVALSPTKTFTRKWCKSRSRKKCCCSSLKTQLRGSLCSDDLISHLSMWANRARVGSKHDKWHTEKLVAPSASFWRSNVGA